MVGAKQGDFHSAQFWIDKTNLYFVRMIRPAGKDGLQTQETQFNKYQKLGGGWMAPEVIFTVDGKTVTTEEYSELRADIPLDARLSIRSISPRCTGKSRFVLPLPAGERSYTRR